MAQEELHDTGVSQKAIVVNEEGKMLAVRRSDSAPRNALRWDLPGGILDFGEDAKEGIIREIKEEAGLEVKDVKVFDVISKFNELKEFWVTIGYTAQALSKDVKLSYEHVEFKWVTLDEFLNLDASDKLKQLVKIYKETK